MNEDDELTSEEEEYVREVILFNDAGIKVCVFHRMEPDVCTSVVFTISKRQPIGEGPLEGRKLRMNICEAHFSADGKWEIIDEKE